MSDDAFYSDDGTPVIPMLIFLRGMPLMALRSLFNGRIFVYEWWDFHWRMFLASRLRARNGKIIWRVTWEAPK